MIIETLVTTRNEDGSVHAVPMGPRVSGWGSDGSPDDAHRKEGGRCDGHGTVASNDQIIEPAQLDFAEFELRPFHPSRTLDNLLRDKHVIVHIVDDVLAIAKCIVGQPLAKDCWHAPQKIAGAVYAGCCRWFELELSHYQLDGQRASVTCRTVAEGRHRDFLGLNRAMHAVIEAAILATRLDFLPIAFVNGELSRLETIVQKTGSSRERSAFRLLHTFVRQTASVEPFEGEVTGRLDAADADDAPVDSCRPGSTGQPNAPTR